MIKFLLILLFGCSIILNIVMIVGSTKKSLSKKKTKESFYYIPRLSELKGKEFSEYIDYLIRDL